MKIRKGDTIKALAGASKGKTGKVLRVLADEGRLVVEGINIRKKHTRPRKQGQKGQKIEFPAPMQISNVMLVCPKCGKPTRIAMKVQENVKKMRECKRCSQSID